MALVWSVVRLDVTPGMAARAADRSLATKDALSTALQFESEEGAFGDAILARAHRAAQTSSAIDAVPVVPAYRRLGLGAVALMAAVALAGLTSTKVAALDPAGATASQTLPK